MSTVDERVVKMTFDNAQFEKNVKHTMDTLSNFEKSCKMDNAAAGFDSLKQAADKLDLSGMSKNAAKETARVADAAADASKSLGGISSAAENVDFSALGKGANAAVSDVNNAAMDVNLNSITTQAEEAGESFNALKLVAEGVFHEIGEMISNLVGGKLAQLGNTIKKFTIDPIGEGFSEYEELMGSIQTIMANTERDFDSDQDIQEVNDALDELNTYADKTIYKFSDMTNAIGQFTTSGLTLEDAVAAVKGVSNAAALSGSSASQVHRVLPQIAEALSAGEVTQMDWRSIQTAQMDSALFRKALGNMAIHMASVGRAEGISAEAGQAVLDGMTMKKALNKDDNKAWSGWLTSDILSNTFKAFTFDKTGATVGEIEEMRKQMEELGFTTKEDQDYLFHLSETASRSATEVRTWSQMWDTFGEAIGSNWAGVWRNVVGDFKRATDTFTFLSQTMSKGVDGLLGGVVDFARAFNTAWNPETGLLDPEAGIRAADIIFGGFRRYAEEDKAELLAQGYTEEEIEEMLGTRYVDQATGEWQRIPGVLDNIVEAISKPLRAIGDAFYSIFGPGSDGQEAQDAFFVSMVKNLIDVADALFDFTQTLIISDDAATAIRNIFEGLFAVLSVGLHIIMDLGAAIMGVVKFVRSFLDPLMDIGMTILGQVGRVLVWLSDRFEEIRIALAIATEPLRNMIGTVEEAIRAFFGFADVPGTIQNLGDAFLSLLDTAWAIVDIPGIIIKIGQAISDVLGFVGKLLGWNTAVEAAQSHFEKTGEQVSVLKIWFEQLLSTPVGDFFKTIYNTVKGVIDTFKEMFGSFTDNAQNAAKEGDIFVKIFEGLRIALNFVLQLLKPVVTTLQFFFNMFVMIFGILAVSLAKFVKSSVDAFLATKPLEKIGQWIEDFKAKAGEFLAKIPGVMEKIGIAFTIAGGVIVAAVSKILGKFMDIFNYFRTTSPEQMIQDLSDWVTGVKKTLQDLMNYLTSHSPSQIIHDMVYNIKKFLNNLKVYIIQKLINKFPEHRELILKVANDIETAFHKMGTRIRSITSAIKDFADEHFGGLIDILKGVGKEAGDQASTVPGHLKEMFESVTDPSKSATEKIKDFWDALISPIKGFYVGNLKDTVDAFKENLGEKISKISIWLSSIPDKIKSGLTKLQEVLNLDNFTPLLDFFRKVAEIVALVRGSQVMNQVTKISKDGRKVLRAWSGLLNAQKKVLKDQDKTKFTDGLLKIAAAVAILGATVYAMSKIENFEEARDRLIQVAAVLVVMQVVSGILKKFKMDGGDSALKSAASLGVLAISLMVSMTAIEKLTEFDWAANTTGLIAMGVAIGVLIGMTALISKAGGEGKNTAIKSAAALGVLAISLQLLLPVIKDFTGFISEMNDEQFQRAVESLVMLGAFVAVMGKAMQMIGDKPMSTGIAFIMMAFGIGMIADALKSLVDSDPVALGEAVAGIIVPLLTFTNAVKKFKAGDMAKTALAFGIFAGAVGGIAFSLYNLAQLDVPGLLAAAGGIVALVAAFAVLAKTTKGLDLIATGQGFLGFAAGVAGVAFSLYNLAQLDWQGLLAAGIALGALVLAFGVLAKTTKGLDLIATAQGFLGFAAGIAGVAFSLYNLAQLDWQGLVGAAVALGALVLSFGVLAKLTNGLDLVATAGGLLGFSAGIAALAFSLYNLVQVDTDKLMPAVIALDALIAAFAVLTLVTNELDVVATATGLVIFAGAAIVLAGALWVMTDALIKLSQNTDAIVYFATQLASHIAEFILATTAMAAFAIGLAALGAGLAIFGIGSILGSAGITLLTTALQGLIALTQNPEDIFNAFYNLGYNIVAGIGKGIMDGITDLILYIPTMVSNIVNGFATKLGIHSPSTVMADEIGKFIPEGIGVGMDENQQPMLDSLSGLLDGLLNKLGEWIQNEGLPMLGQAAVDFGNWFMNEGLPAIAAAIPQIMGVLGNLLQQFWNWMQSDGFPMLGKALSDFWNWVQTDGIPMLLNFVGEIFKVLGELLQKLGAWIVSDGLPAAGKALEDIMHELGKLGGKLLEWASGLPDAIWKGLGDIADWAGKMGEDILNGIKDGIEKFPNAIADAVVGLASGGLDQIKAFFGIASPSKVMRDEVGQYVTLGLAEGILAYSRVASDAALKLGSDTAAGVESGLSNLSPSYGIDVVPVIDMSSYDRSAAAMMQDFNGRFDGITMQAYNAQNIDAQFDTSNMVGALREQSYAMMDKFDQMRISQHNDGITMNNNLESLITELNNKLDNLNIYMDSGALVGSIAPEMDRHLGVRQTYASRGMY